MKIRMKNDTWLDIGTAANPINVRMADGTWKAFGGGGGVPLYLRAPNGTWIAVTTAGIGNLFTLYFTAMDFNSLAYNRFIESTGWEIERRFVYEYGREDGSDGSSGRPIGEEIVPSVGGHFESIATSAMGWIGDENNTFVRYNNRDISWYSLPIGMFIAAAQVTRYLYQTHQSGSWADTAEHAGTEVEARLSGYSLIKSQMPWMNSFNQGFTTAGVGAGTGQLLSQGPTPDTYKLNINYTHSDIGIVRPTPLYVTTEPYEIRVIRNRNYTIDNGTTVWAGDLNDLGMQNGVHGLPYVPEYKIVQTFTSANYQPKDALSYHLRVSPLDDPPPFDYSQWIVQRNYINVMFNVRVNYRF